MSEEKDFLEVKAAAQQMAQEAQGVSDGASQTAPVSQEAGSVPASSGKAAQQEAPKGPEGKQEDSKGQPEKTGQMVHSGSPLDVSCLINGAVQQAQDVPVPAAAAAKQAPAVPSPPVAPIVPPSLENDLMGIRKELVLLSALIRDVVAQNVQVKSALDAVQMKLNQPMAPAPGTDKELQEALATLQRSMDFQDAKIDSIESAVDLLNDTAISGDSLQQDLIAGISSAMEKEFKDSSDTIVNGFMDKVNGASSGYLKDNLEASKSAFSELQKSYLSNLAVLKEKTTKDLGGLINGTNRKMMSLFVGTYMATAFAFITLVYVFMRL